MTRTDRLTIARACVTESREARLGLGHWAACSLAVRKGNARTLLAAAARYRNGAL